MKADFGKWAVSAAIVLLMGIGCRLNVTNTGGNDGAGDGGTDEVPAGTDDVVLPSEGTQSFFTAFQLDPIEEDTAGPKFVAHGDVNQDGLTDLVSGWNQSQPIQLHLQERDETGAISFRAITIAGTSPVAVIAGVEFGQINDDGWLDIVVLVKGTGSAGWCPKSPPQEISRLEGEIIVYFSPGNPGLIADGDSWTQMILYNPYVADRWIHNQFPGSEWVSFDELKAHPENAGFTALAVGEMDGNPGDDIVVALNPGECKELGQEPPINTVDLWLNPGPGLSGMPSAWGVPADLPLSGGVPISIMLDAPRVTDIALDDIDDDGDLDIVAAYHDSISLNVRWARNPLVAGGYVAATAGGSDGDVDRCVEGPNDGLPCPNGDIDCAGSEDGACIAGQCVGGANPGADCQDSTGCDGEDDGKCTATSWHYVPDNWEIRPIGQVDSHANVVAIGDVDGDGFEDIAVRSTIGRLVQWFRRPNPLTVQPEFPPTDPVPDRFNFPWPVFTLTEFLDRDPEGIALGDVTGDGLNDLMVAVAGGVYWYDGTEGDSVFDPWVGRTIIVDEPQDSGGTADGSVDSAADGEQSGVGVGVEGTDTATVINWLLVVDLDGDGRNDVIGTLDRQSGSGLSDDRLVWYRNVRTED